MPQTMYTRLWPPWISLAVVILLTALLVAMAVTQGTKSPAVWIVLFVEALTLSTFTILDPEVTIESRGMLPDGSVVKIRRPIVGFKRCERKVGTTGDYEVRIDGFRYEEAYIRL